MTKLTAPNGYRIERVTDKNNKWRYYFICTTKVLDQQTGKQRECGFKYSADNRVKWTHICGQTRLDRYIIKFDDNKKGERTMLFIRFVLQMLHRYLIDLFQLQIFQSNKLSIKIFVILHKQFWMLEEKILP
jgi:hypothetical protein